MQRVPKASAFTYPSEACVWTVNYSAWSPISIHCWGERMSYSVLSKSSKVNLNVFSVAKLVALLYTECCCGQNDEMQTRRTATSILFYSSVYWVPHQCPSSQRAVWKEMPRACNNSCPEQSGWALKAWYVQRNSSPWHVRDAEPQCPCLQTFSAASPKVHAKMQTASLPKNLGTTWIISASAILRLPGSLPPRLTKWAPT